MIQPKVMSACPFIKIYNVKNHRVKAYVFLPNSRKIFFPNGKVNFRNLRVEDPSTLRNRGKPRRKIL